MAERDDASPTPPDTPTMVSSLFKLSRHFSITTFAVVIASALLASFAYRYVSEARLIDAIEMNSASLTRTTVRQLGPRVGRYIAELDGASADSVAKHPEAHALRSAISALYQDFPLIGWSVYDVRGREVLSDSLELRGEQGDSREAAAAALTRLVRSDLVLRFQREGVPASRRVDVVATFASINTGVRGGDGVLLLRVPVTEQWVSAQRMQPFVFLGVALIGAVFYVMMSLALRRAEHATRFEIAKQMATDEVVRRTVELIEQQNREKASVEGGAVGLPRAEVVATRPVEPRSFGPRSAEASPAKPAPSPAIVAASTATAPASSAISSTSPTAPITTSVTSPPPEAATAASAVAPSGQATPVAVAAAAAASVVHSPRLSTIEAELRTAYERGQFLLHFQPVVSLLTNSIVGAEALVRWEHPTRGLLAAGEFMAAAEKSGMVVPIGERVLEQACQLAGAWSRVTSEPIFISVNLSAHQFDQPRALIGSIQRALSRGGLTPSLLELEVTQALLARRSDETLALLRELRCIGVRLTVHDFGTSLSDLLHVRNYPINTLKIDRALLQNVPMNTNDTTIVRSLVAMARGLGLTVAAQGLERKDHVGLLVDMGCTFGQGEAFGVPLMADDFFRLLVNRQTPASDQTELAA